MSDQETKEIMVLGQIREVIGDNGKMMQDELVRHIKNMQDVVSSAELVVSTSGFKCSIVGLDNSLKKLNAQK